MDGRQRVGAGIAGVTALALAFGTGLALGGSDDQTGQRGRPIALPGAPIGDRIALANADLSATDSCEELLGWYVDRGLERVTPYGWDSGVVYFDSGGIVEGDAARQSSAGAPAVPQVDRATNGDTGTNVQESGVDEPDVVKTDGELLVRVQDDELTAYDVTGAEPTWLDSIDLPGIADAEILLAGDTVVAVGADTESDPDPGAGRPYDGSWERAGDTRMLVVDLADPAALEITDDRAYEATLVSARLHGSVVRLALSAGLPDLDFVDPEGLRTDDSALERNRDIVRESTLADWLPGVVVTGADGEAGARDELLECSDVALPDDDAGLGTLAVVGFDATTPESWDASAVATDSQIVYASADRLVLATSPWPAWCCVSVDGPSSSADDGTTRLYSFALSGTDTTYVASGEVEGAIADRWAMDEADGVLRLAVGPTSMTGNFNSVVTLQESGDDLREIGRVDELGVGEEIKSVRWFDDLAIVVTFRQIDPLYAVDLTDPSSPELMGELKIPGFSEYLHPLGGWRMIGIGQDADAATGMTTGAQAALFDVQDLTDPRRLDVATYSPGSRAHAGLDPRQFTWLPDARTALTVVSEGDVGTTGWVSVLRVEDGRLSNRMVEVEYGAEVDQVRLVPLPTGRVVLVTGDGVSFFDLDAAPLVVE